MPATSARISIDVELKAAQESLAKAAKRLRKLNIETLLKLKPGALADTLYELRAMSTAACSVGTVVSELTGPLVKQIEDHFIETLKVGEASGLQGMAARVQVSESPVPVVDDWEKFYAHISKTKSFDLLNRAVNRNAVRERWDAKKKVPGVSVFHAKKVSCTKLKGGKR